MDESMTIKILKEKCISCGACVIICPFSAIKLVHGKAVVDTLACAECRKCIYKCYTRAIYEEKGSI